MRDTLRNSRIPAHAAFAFAGVCPAGVISDISWQLLEKFLCCDGTRRISPRDYDYEPAIYIEACGIIEPFRQAAEARAQERVNGHKGR